MHLETDRSYDPEYTGTILAPAKETLQVMTWEGVTLTLRSVTAERMTGGYTKNRTPDPNGDYFLNADRTRALLASDYNLIRVTLEIHNSSSQPFHFSSSHWEFRKPNGQKYHIETNYRDPTMDYYIDQQTVVPATGTREVELPFLLQSARLIETLTVFCPITDYSDDYWYDHIIESINKDNLTELYQLPIFEHEPLDEKYSIIEYELMVEPVLLA